MTYPHREPVSEGGGGCFGCAYLGFGPGFVPRCRHPGRYCWRPSTPAGRAHGCRARREVGEILDPPPVDLAAHAGAVAEERWRRRMARTLHARRRQRWRRRR